MLLQLICYVLSKSIFKYIILTDKILSSFMALNRIQYPSPGFSKHWKESVGKRMLKRVSTTPTKEQINSFNELYMCCDTLADAVVVDLFEGLGHKRGHQLLHTLLEQGLNAVPDIPDSLRALYTSALHVPEWVDDDLLKQGATFCQRAGVFSLITLRNYSLMGGYESAAINKPLIFTGALKGGPAKRLSDTLKFWVDVTGMDAMKPTGAGFNAAIQVRIIHALARYYIKKSPEWKDEDWGIPINTGDMVATYLGFSLVYLEGLRMLQFKPILNEELGVYHLWKYIGYLLGIPQELLPANDKEAIQTLYKWTMTQPLADIDTIALAHALVNAPLSATFPNKVWQKKILVKIYLGFNRFYLGRAACNRMHLPNTIFKVIPYIAASINYVHECLVLIFPSFKVRAIKKGRNAQVEVTDSFLKSIGYK